MLGNQHRTAAFQIWIRRVKNVHEVKGITELSVRRFRRSRVTHRTQFMFFPVNWDASICPWHSCVQHPCTPLCHGRVQGHLRPLWRGLAKGGTGAPVQQEVGDDGCNHSTIVRHIPIAWKEFINLGHLETSPTPVPTFALGEIDIWYEGHVVDSEKTSTTDPGWTTALLTCSAEVSSGSERKPSGSRPSSGHNRPRVRRQRC